jgi:hypothetical protein
MTDDQEQPTRKRGRPGTYANAAERARAWRQRQKDLIAKAQQAAAPVIIEKVVEKIVEVPVERIVEKPVPAPRRAGAGKAAKPDASKLVPHLQSKFNSHGGEARAKNLRVSAARAATTAREILGLFGSWESMPETEKAFLHQVSQFFNELNTVFERSQRQAKVAQAKAVAEFEEKREAQVRETIRLTFGATPDPAEVLATAKALQRFASTEIRTEHARRKGVDRYYFFLPREYEFRRAMAGDDAMRLAREIAEVRMEAGERGRAWMDREERCYSAGWSDFIAFRTNEKPAT